MIPERLPYHPSMGHRVRNNIPIVTLPLSDHNRHMRYISPSSQTTDTRHLQKPLLARLTSGPVIPIRLPALHMLSVVTVPPCMGFLPHHQ